MKYPTTNNYQQNIHNLSEIDVINEIYKSKQAKLFDDLMKGTTNLTTSHSEADMALANILAFVQEIIRKWIVFLDNLICIVISGMKNVRIPYGEQTLFKAINEANNIYTLNNKRR